MNTKLIISIIVLLLIISGLAFYFIKKNKNYKIRIVNSEEDQFHDQKNHPRNNVMQEGH